MYILILVTYEPKLSYARGQERKIDFPRLRKDLVLTPSRISGLHLMICQKKFYRILSLHLFKINALSNFQGLLCLWRGMLPALYRHAIYTGMRMSVYEEVRSTLQKENKVRNKKFKLYLNKHFFF